MAKRIPKVLTLCAAMSVWATPARVHPHVFAEAKLNITIASDGTVDKLSHVWRFDEFFSETVLFEFDKNTDTKISADELADISKTIVDSIGEYNYFEAVLSNDKEVKMAKPADLTASFDDKVLVITFSNSPVEKVSLTKKTSFGIYDPTFYTAIDFVEDKDMTVANLPASCKSTVIRPNADEALTQNQQSLTEAFFNDPQGTDMSKIFATRIEVSC
ncbi:MAG: DUF1007 family protein [Rhizobiaceae bacterium]